MINNAKNMRWVTTLICAMMVPGLVFAGNRTISGAFDGNEPSMQASPANCDVTPRPYKDVGTIQVSSSGTYRIVDAGNDFVATAPEGDIADVVVLIYSGAFDPNTPAANRVATIDVGESIALTLGTPYQVVVQHWCDEIVGSFAVIVDGPGDVSGLGFNTQSYTLGEFVGGSPTADFGTLGVHRYETSGPVILPRTGNYYFSELSAFLTGGFVHIRVYDQSFDPDNPQANLLDASGVFESAGFFTLDGSGTYEFVAVDLFDSVAKWQFVLFPPGNINFNPGLTGAWGTPGVSASGILMEVFPDSNLAFMAWFTFPEQLPVLIASDASMEADDGKTRTEALGSSDQRWLTAFGILPGSGNFMNLAYENATGGLFNKAEPSATIDSNYGTGWIELFSCSEFALNYNLPDGLVRTTQMRRLVNDGLAYCRSFIKAAPPFPPF